MTASPHIHALLLAGGEGRRLGGHPKQYRDLLGKAVVDWSLDSLSAHPAIAGITVVGAPPPTTRAARLPRAAPGATRRASVASGLALVPSDASHVLVHDAARPGLDASVLDRLFDALRRHPDAGAIIPVLAVTDTMIDDAGRPVDRDALTRVQTPQLCRVDLLRAAHQMDWDVEPTDDAQMIAALGGAILRVAGSQRLDKLTVADDWDRLEGVLGRKDGDTGMTRDRRIATGTGFDVHALVDGDHVWIGGIRIAHDRALSGHSDADVALHALTDALLGALGQGDIGSHFPPTDARWKGASSDQFLAHARHLLEQAHGRLHHVDVTIICEAPKIGPHRDAMRSRIAQILNVSLAQVGVKATTSESLGFTGRGEGIAAQAVATIDLPWSHIDVADPEYPA